MNACLFIYFQSLKYATPVDNVAGICDFRQSSYTFRQSRKKVFVPIRISLYVAHIVTLWVTIILRKNVYGRMPANSLSKVLY